MLNKVTALLAAAVLSSGCTGPAAVPPASSAPSSTTNPINVGTGADSPGLGLLDPDSLERTGFDANLVDWLGTNTTPRFTPVRVDVAVDDRINAIEEGRVQMVVDTLSITDKRRDQIGFAGPYLITRQSIMVRTGDDRVKSLDDLAGRTVCTQARSTSLDQLNSGGIRDKVTITTETSARRCTQRLLDKEVDAFSTDQLILHGFSMRDPALTLLPITFGAQERYGVGLPKGDVVLCRRISESIRAFITNGAWDQFFRTDFGDLDPAGYKPDPYRLDPCT